MVLMLLCSLVSTGGAFADVPRVVVSLYPVNEPEHDESDGNGLQRVVVGLPPPLPAVMVRASLNPRTLKSPHVDTRTMQLAATPEEDDNGEPDNSDGINPDDAPDDNPLVPIERDDLDLLLLEIRLNSLILVEDMPAYIQGSSIVIPLRDLSQILDFPIGVDPLAGTANGWFVRENNLFSLNVARGEVVIAGKVTPFDPRLVEIHEDDIYVDARLLSRWFPIDIRFDLSNLLIRLTSREPLPIEKKLARDDYHTKALAGRTAAENNFPKKITPPKLISMPVVDVNTDFSYAKQDGSPDSADSAHSITMTGDLLYSNAEVFISGSNDEKVDTLRLRLERKDPDGDAIGRLPLGMTINDIQVGDVVMPQLSEVSRSELGRGLYISNMPLDRPTEFDTVTLDGDLPLGWDLELYRNEVLLNFASSQTDGRYTFEDVPLLFGVNVLRLVFYGPQGQEREEIQHFRVEPSQVLPGEIHYRFVTNQHDRPFLVRDDNADQDLVAQRRILLETTIGVNERLSLGSSYVELPFSTKAERYVSVNGIGSYENILSRINLVQQIGNGWAATLNAQTSAFGINFIGEHNHYRSFFSEQISDTTDPLSTSSTLRVEGSIPETFLPRLPFAVSVKHDRQTSGDSTSTFTNRGSVAIGNASLTSTTNFTRTRADGEKTNTMDGTWLLGGRYKALRISGSVAYQSLPAYKLQSASVSGTWNIAEAYQATSGITHTFSDTEDSTQYSLGLNTQTDLAAIGLNFNYTSPTDMAANLSMSYALGHDPDSGKFILENHGIAEFGLVGARVYLDLDDDGQFSEGDEPLENVGFKGNGGRIRGKTDEFGHALLTGLEAYRNTDLEIDTGTLDDPFWVASPPGYQIIPRPGSFSTVDFPVVTTGEVDGVVYRQWADRTDEAAGVYIQRVDTDGNVTQEIRSAYDGFYLFDFVRPGKYTLRINPEQLSALGLSTADEYSIDIEGDGTVIAGTQFLLVSVSNEY